METLAQDKQVAIINNSIEIFKTAPELLRANQERSSKAVKVGSDILSQWVAAWKIEDEDEKMQALEQIDARSNNFLANCNKALKEENELRAAITQMMDEFKKMFTAAENSIDKSKADSIPSKIQTQRDTYAGEVFKIQERKRKEAERQAAISKAKIDLKAAMEVNISNHYNDTLLAHKQKLQADFNRVDLENYEKANGYFQRYKAPDLESALKYEDNTSYSSLLSLNDCTEIKNQVIPAFIESKKTNWASELTSTCFDLFNKMPSKKMELEEKKILQEEAKRQAEEARQAEEKRQAEIAAANEAERQRLEIEAAEARKKEAERQAELKRQQEESDAARRLREEEEQKRLQDEAEEAKRVAEQEAEIKKQGEHTMVMFEQEAAVAETAAPEARQGYEITLTHQAGWVQIFQLWFENEGKNLPIDKIGGTKLEQMKAWAEKYAHKTGTKIESKFINYKESFKAVNRKAK